MTRPSLPREGDTAQGQPIVGPGQGAFGKKQAEIPQPRVPSASRPQCRDTQSKEQQPRTAWGHVTSRLRR